jgi:LmbE family N-acetylglucosaminyl deacetylase
MMRGLKLMAVFAHPDDESLAAGGLLAKYAAEGVETYLVCATRGEAGRYIDEYGRLPAEMLGRIRTNELRKAAEILGIRRTFFLGYRDGQLDQVDPDEATSRIAEHIRLVRPDVILTFGPDGLYGHPDHVAISQLTSAAVIAAAETRFDHGSGRPAHSVSKVYHLAWSAETWDRYQSALKRLVLRVDGVERGATAWPDWAITTVVDTSAHADTARRAVASHHSQMAMYGRFNTLPAEEQSRLWQSAELVRQLSSVNIRRERETDLFQGLRSAREMSRVA